MKFFISNKEVEIVEIEMDHGEGAWVIDAHFEDGTDLTEKEIDELNTKYAAEIYDRAYQNWVCAAEAEADAREDR